MHVDLGDKNCYVKFRDSIWQVIGVDYTTDFRGFARLEYRFGPQPQAPLVDVFGSDLGELNHLSEMEVIAWAARAE